MSDDDAVFKAMGDANRRDLLDCLHARNGLTLNQLCENRAMTRQAVTKHLSILEAANLVITVKKGREKFHYLNPVPISAIYLRWIGRFQADRMQALHDLAQTLKEQKNEDT